MTDQTRIKPRISAVFITYFFHAKKYPWVLFFFVFGSIAVQISDLILPLYLKQLFNLLASSAPTEENVRWLTLTIGIIAFISIAGWSFRRLMGWASMEFDARVMRDLLSSSFAYLAHHSYNFFTSNFAGSLTHKISKFSRAFETIADDLIMTFLPTLVYVGGAVIILFLRNRTLGLILLVWTIIFMTFQLWMAKWRQPIREERAAIDTKQTGTLADAISNHMNIMLFSGNRHEEVQVESVSSQWLKATLRSWKFDDKVWGALGLLMIAINITLLYGAMVYWRAGQLTIGDFILIQSYLIGTFNNLVGVNRQLRRFYDAIADASEMITILETTHEVKDVLPSKVITVREGAVAFRDVSFAFDNNSVLERLNLVIKPSEKLALVGPSGAGKSTITKLLLRFFDVQAGVIEIDGQNIAEVSQDSLRDAISFVPQEPILFHRSLMENIRYGRRSATDDEVLEAARQAHCHEFISQLPEQYGTFVGERGIKLSGGERQRVAIARAILKNAPILVLDEATSSLDSESEALIQDALEKLMQSKTVIVIAHRLSTIMKMDRIVVLESGKVIATGTHQELLEQGGLYQKLWNIQAGGFLVDEPTSHITDAQDELPMENESEEDEDKEELATPPLQK